MKIRLSDDLKLLLDEQLSRGNVVEAVSYPEDRVFVVLRNPFWLADCDLLVTVKRWQFDDQHYADDRYEGYRSTGSDDIIAFKKK